MGDGHPGPPAEEWSSVERLLQESGLDLQTATRPTWWPLQPEGETDEPELEPQAGGLYDEVFDRVFQRVASQESVVARERARGRDLFEELVRHPPARQLLLIRNSTRYRSPMLCEHLIEECQAEGFKDVFRALSLARLAVAVADLLTPADCVGEESLASLKARTWAQLGNACRINADHTGAEQAFEQARAIGQTGGIELLAKARILDLEASLRRDQRRFQEAFQLLDEVISIYHQLGQRNLLGRSLKQKS
ncbi:MAG TPA: hypothetical protein VEL74_00020, partial [Thermoanaerobaculia bacterium]|nr:hypothetical protein [Thermoanaerobaculia bacterium]